MEFFIDNRIAFAELMVRLILGIALLSQGYDKLFRIGIVKSGEAVSLAVNQLHASKGLIYLITGTTAAIEFLGGLLLLTGWWILPVTYITMAGLLPVTVAMCYSEPLWNLRQIWTRLVMMIFLLMLPADAHVFSLENLLR